MIQDSSASMTGIAMIDVIGKLTPGVISMTFKNNTQKNIVVRNGTQPSPSDPSTGFAIWLRTKSTPTSPTFWRPVGTSFGAWNARQNKRPSTAVSTNIITIGNVTAMPPEQPLLDDPER